MLRRLTSRASGNASPVVELSNLSPNPIFVITRRRQRSPDVVVEEGEEEDVPQHPVAANDPRGVQGEHRIYPRPVYLQTHFDILYYLGMSPMKGDGQWGSRWQKVAFAIVTGLAILASLLTVKQFIVMHAKKGDLLDYIAVGSLVTIPIYQMYYLKLVIWNHQSVSCILDESTRIQPGILYKFPTPKVSKTVVVLASLRIIIAIASAMRLDWWLDDFTMEDIILTRSTGVGYYAFIWDPGNSTTLQNEVYKKFGNTLSVTSVLMGVLGYILEFVRSLFETLLPDILLIAALHTNRLSKIFQSNIYDTLGNIRPNAGSLPMLREKHDMFHGMIEKLNDSFGGFFILLHVTNFIFSAYFLLDALRGESDYVFLPATLVTIPVIACSYIFAAKSVTTTHAVHNFIRDRDYRSDENDDGESNKVTKFLKVLKSHPIGIGRDNFLLDATFMQRFVGLVISTFLLFVDKQEKKA